MRSFHLMVLEANTKNWGSLLGGFDSLPLSEEVVATTRRTRGADCEEAAHAIGSLAAVLSQG